jgi:hypothetical protein
MARLQVLHLPGGTDGSPVFVLVMDQLPERTSMDAAERVHHVLAGIADRVGARSGLVFCGDLDIPDGEVLRADVELPELLRLQQEMPADFKAAIQRCPARKVEFDGDFWTAFRREVRTQGSLEAVVGR